MILYNFGDLSGMNMKLAFLTCLFFVISSSFAPLSMVAPFLVVLASVLSGLLLINTLKSEEDKKFLAKFFLIAFFMRVFLAVILHMVSSNSSYSSGFFIDDGFGYSQNGWVIANRMERGISIAEDVVRAGSASGTIHIYDYLNSAVYFLVGVSPLTMFFLNCFVGSITAVFVYFTAKELFGCKVAKASTLFYIFWPSLILWSTQNLKEPLTIFFIVLCFWAVVSFLKSYNLFYILVICLSLFVLTFFRQPVAKIIAISIALHMLFLLFRLIRHSPFLALIACLLFAMIFFGFSKEIIKFLNPVQSESYALSDILMQIDYNRSVRATASLAIMPEYRILSLTGLLFYFPVGLLAVLFGPFPWQLFSASQIMALPEMVVWYFMFPCVIRGALSAWKDSKKYIFSILAYVVFMTCLMAFLEGNIGTIFRHRSFIIVFFLIFMAAGINARGKNNRNFNMERSR